MMATASSSETADPFLELCALPYEQSEKRDTCQRCRRPSVVCVCSCFPESPVSIETRVVILQHPNEEGRCLATVPLLVECVSRDKVHVIRGKRFGDSRRHPVLHKALTSPNSYILYPGRNAIDLHSLHRDPIGCNSSNDGAALIVLDGTWAQAKALYTQNPTLHNIQQVTASLQWYLQSYFDLSFQYLVGSLYRDTPEIMKLL
ncbi:tRNA-uridine aminocarboxypropyltransferase 2 [Geodia barretti]|uniref:tRNA-uridine aminocarboxypropyltransferase n=1 Tax=Geodia barretti TaxID=519541 RepID=A0AA35WCM3_GEOBA|nr:tRNA-uridine aminocarboxypropyltransferase 2 [Geodia barretti]